MAYGLERMKRLARTVLRRPSKAASAPIWSGIYASFDEAPAAAAGFDSEAAAVAAERLLRETQADPMPDEAVLDHEVLALAVRLTGRGRVNVLDVGGGVGQSYAALRRMTNVELRYGIVELPAVIEHAARLWSGEVEFVGDLDAVPFAPDVIFAKGVLQYWPDYAAYFRRLLSLSARFVIAEKVPMLAGRQYVTVQQDVYGARVPYWFMDRNVLVNAGRDCGYRLLLQRRLEREYEQSNFPPEYRSSRAASLFFERMDK